MRTVKVQVPEWYPGYAIPYYVTYPYCYPWYGYYTWPYCRALRLDVLS